MCSEGFEWHKETEAESHTEMDKKGINDEISLENQQKARSYVIPKQ